MRSELCKGISRKSLGNVYLQPDLDPTWAIEFIVTIPRRGRNGSLVREAIGTYENEVQTHRKKNSWKAPG